MVSPRSLLCNSEFIKKVIRKVFCRILHTSLVFECRLITGIKCLYNKHTLQWDPYSCLTRVTSCYDLEGHWFWNQVCFPPMPFANWELRLPESAKELIFRLHCLSPYDLCFCFSHSLPFCCPWCCSVVLYDWECALSWSILWAPLIYYRVWRSLYTPTHNKHTHKLGSNTTSLTCMCTRTCNRRRICGISVKQWSTLGDTWEAIDQMSIFSTSIHLWFSPALFLSFSLPFISPLTPHEITLISASPQATCEVTLPV